MQTWTLESQTQNTRPLLKEYLPQYILQIIFQTSVPGTQLQRIVPSI